MESLSEDLAILNRFNFDRQPVAIKYLYLKPKGIEKLQKSMSICEMLIEAQTTKPFYAEKDNFACAGKVITGMADVDPIVKSGQLSYMGSFSDPRAGARYIDQYPKISKDIVKYVVFSPLAKLSFDPDVLVITCSIEQAEVILRASSYKNGRAWSPKMATYVACSWLLVYPYMTGELNYIITGLSHGMTRRRLLPKGLLLISIPFDLLPTIAQNLQEMEWKLKSHIMSRENYEKWSSVEREKVKQQTEITLELF